jgi:hypothetical protein
VGFVSRRYLWGWVVAGGRLDAEIRSIIAEAVVEAAERARGSKECMNAEEAHEFLGLTRDEWKKRWRRIPKRAESERKHYYLREDLLGYLRSLPRQPETWASDYPSDYEARRGAPRGTERERFSA